MATTDHKPAVVLDEAAARPRAATRRGMSWIARAAQENRELRDRYARLSAEYAELLAHARAAVALHANHRGDVQADGMSHLHGYLEERGQLPDPETPASALLARAFARTADADTHAQETTTDPEADPESDLESAPEPTTQKGGDQA